MKLIPADRFSFTELTSAYNQTRVDYLVPMPMNEARLRDYVTVYDVNLAASCVAVENDAFLGLGMLGTRLGRAWITRLGVLPTDRRRGLGQVIMDELLAQAQARGLPDVWLEVISGNDPAQRLFERCGFVYTRDLIVARRAPDNKSPFLQQPLPDKARDVTVLSREEVLAKLAERQVRPNWLNELESMRHLHSLHGLAVTLEDGGQGWISYEVTPFQLMRIVVECVSGNPTAVTAAALQAMHQRHPRHDAIMENLPVGDSTWPGYEAVGYFEAFQRVEMIRKNERQ
jgi:GNAT superfamily N-acetyltransferase